MRSGTSPDAEIVRPQGSYRVLHQAACRDAIAVAGLLLARGADVDARDAVHRATPLGWALYTRMPAAVAFFAARTRDVFTLAAGAEIEPLRALLANDPSLANAVAESVLGLGTSRVETGETPLFALPADDEEALAVAGLLLASGASPRHRNHVGQTPADKARSRGLLDVADWLDRGASSGSK